MDKNDAASSSMPKMKWSYNMRLVVHMLFSRRELSPSELQAIFSKVFEREIRLLGFVSEVPYSKIVSQKNDKSIKDWTRIRRPASSKLEREKRRWYEAEIELHIGAKSPTAVEQQRQDTTSTPIHRPRAEATPTAASPCEDSAPVNSAPVNSAPVNSAVECSGQPETYVPHVQSSRAAPLAQSYAAEDNCDELSERPSKRQRHDGRSQKASEPTQAAMRTPKAPKARSAGTKSKAKRRPNAIYTYPRPSDEILRREPLLLTPKQLKELDETVNRVSAGQAHPPMRGLLFRVWNSTELHDSISGHVSRQKSLHVDMGPEEPPRCDQIPWRDLTNHFDKNIGITWPSAWISTSDSMVWTIQKLVKSAKDSGNMWLSIISADELGREGTYHANPYYKELLKRFPFHNGADRYQGLHEFLVYDEIPRNAILHHITALDLLRLNADPAVAQLLRLDILEQPGDYRDKIRPQLEALNVILSPQIAGAIAKFAKFLGLSAISPAHLLSHFVCDIIQGWRIRLPKVEDEAWGQMAAHFARSLENASNFVLRSSESQKLELAFLDGARWGSSCHYNSTHTSERVRLMQDQAKKYGLHNPAQLLRSLSKASRPDMDVPQSNVEALLRGEPLGVRRTRLDFRQYEYRGEAIGDRMQTGEGDADVDDDPEEDVEAMAFESRHDAVNSRNERSLSPHVAHESEDDVLGMEVDDGEVEILCEEKVVYETDSDGDNDPR